MANSKEESDSRHFDGFDSPTTTPVPDVVFDEFLSWLGEAELKALLYIIRRTFGFKKNEDPISFNQFLRGITTRDGRILDQGCGVRSRTTLSGALKSLESKGIIQSAKGVDERGENQTTVYSLRFRNPMVADQEASVAKHGASSGGVVRNSYHRGTASAPPVVRQTYPQQTDLQQTVRQQTASSNSFESVANLQKPSNSKFSKNRDNFQTKAALAEEPQESQQRTSKRGLTPVGDVLSTRARKLALRSPKTASGMAADPSGGNKTPGTLRRRLGRPPKAPPQIEWLIDQVSGEFHDGEHVPQNLSQAARLLQQSGKSEGAFYQLIGEARSVTKQYDIKKRASGEAGEFGARNKMPYFFTVLKDLLGMKGEDNPTPQIGGLT